MSDEQTEKRLQQIETRLDRGNARLDTLDSGQTQSNLRLDALDRGQAAMIRRMDSDEVERKGLRDEIVKNTEATTQTLEQTHVIRQLAENMQAAGRFFNGVATVLNRVAKWLLPIVMLGLAIWGGVWAWLHGGKPPSVG